METGPIGTALSLRPGRADVLPLALIVGCAVAWLTGGLAHDSLWLNDESFHQVVTRHVHDAPFRPTLYDDPVHDTPELYRDYWNVRTWLVKPVGGFWGPALLMGLVGTGPLAFRLAGFLGYLVALLGVYLVGRAWAGRALALVSSLALASLPLGWILTQARFISDSLDLQTGGVITLAMLALFVSVARRSARFAAVAGAVTGFALLVKSALGLTPLGVAMVLWALGAAGFCRGPRLRDVGLMLLTTVAVAVPWNVYAALKWPVAFSQGTWGELMMHLTTHGSVVGHRQWVRPPDAVFNEILTGLSGPLPVALSVLAGVWLVVRAWRTRDFVLVGLAAWLWATWLGHSLPAMKIIHHLWNAEVPLFIALALLLRDAWSRLPLATAAGASLLTPLLVPRWPWLSVLRQYVPPPAQFRQSDVLASMQLTLLGLALGLVAVLVARRAADGVPEKARWASGACLTVAVAWVAVGDGVATQRTLATEAWPQFHVAFSKTVGQAIDALTPKRSVVCLATHGDAPASNEVHNLLFWSNRLVLPGASPGDYPEHGFHPYLVSAVAQPWEPLPVPASAWLRAWDLTRPAPVPPPPEGLTPLDVRIGAARVVGYAREPSTAGGADRYAFIIEPHGRLPRVGVTFQLRDGRTVAARYVAPLASVRELVAAAWFVLPVVGPPFESVASVNVSER